MAGDSKDFEFRIRAADYSKKVFADLVKTLEELTVAQEQQLEAAKRGEVGVRSLQSSLDRLRDVAKSLASQGALTQVFQKQSAALLESAEAAEKAREAQAAYAKQIAGVEKLTKDQAEEQKKLASAVIAREKAEQRNRNALERTVESLKSYGIAVDDIAGEQARLQQAFTAAEAAVEKQDRAIRNLDTDLRKHRETVAAAAAEEKRAAEAQAQIAAKLAARAAEEQRLATIVERSKQQQLDAAQQLLKVEQADQEAAARRRADALREKEALEQQRVALTRLADQAIATAKGYQTLARTINSVRGNNLSDTIRDIANPAAAALRSMDGLEAAISRVEKSITSINGPVKDYRATLQQLEAAQKQISAVAGNVDGYRRQIDALRAARQEYVQARAAVSALAEQMRGGIGGADVTAQMARAQSELRRASDAMAQQTAKTRELRNELRQAGVDTTNLAKSEQELIQQSQRTTSAVTQLGAAVKKYGQEVEKSGKGFAFFRDEGRTTLSFMQRMRGEVLALASAYVGVQGAINLVRDSINSVKTLEGINSKLLVLTEGDQAKAAEEFAYLRAQVNRLGLDFESAAGAYTKFAIAAKSSGASQQETRFIFEQFALAANKARLSTADFEGALKAIEQMMSKGKIQAEELRGQLGDRLPGALAIAAKGAGVTVEQFSKMLELGEVSSDYVLNLARELGKTYSAAGEVTNGILEAENRFSTAVLFFKNEIAKSGLEEAYKNLLGTLTEFLQSDQGAQLARQLGQAFTSVVESIQWLIQNIDYLKVAFAGLAGLTLFRMLSAAVGTITTLATAVMGLTTAARGLGIALPTVASGIASVGAATGASAATITTATRAATLLGVALRGLLRVVPILGAALLAYDVYSALKGQDGAARQAGADVGREFMEGYNSSTRGLGTRNVSGVIGGARGATADPGGGATPELAAFNALMKTVEKEQEKVNTRMRNANLRGAKAELEERKRIIDEQYQYLRDQAEANLKYGENREEALKKINALSLAAQAAEEKRYYNEQKSNVESAANKRIQIAREVADELGRIEDELAKRSTAVDPTSSFDERLKTRLAAVANEYDKLGRKIAQMGVFDKQGAADAQQKLDLYIAQRQQVETVLAKQEELKRLETEMNAQIELRAARIAAVQAQYEAGVITENERLAKVKEINVTMEAGVRGAAQSMKVFAESIKDLLNPTQYQELLNKIEQVQQNADARRLNTAAVYEAAQVRLNSLLAERARLLERIRVLQEGGRLTPTQAEEAKRAVMDQTRGPILEQITATQQAGTAATTPANAEQIKASNAELDVMKIKLTEVNTGWVQIATTIETGFMTVLNNSVAALSDALVDMALGQKSAAEGFQSMRAAAAQFFADFLKKIAQAIIQQMILNALKQNPYTAAFAYAYEGASGSSRHQGGLVNGSGHSRRIDPSYFAGAARYHSGGLPGLRTDEVTAILQKGEEVLARDDPRNILNGGGGGGGGSTRFVLVDDRAKVPEAMTGAEGERVILETIRRNAPTVRQYTGG